VTEVVTLAVIWMKGSGDAQGLCYKKSKRRMSCKCKGKTVVQRVRQRRRHRACWCGAECHGAWQCGEERRGAGRYGGDDCDVNIT